jgi:hypothetical protein
MDWPLFHWLLVRFCREWIGAYSIGPCSCGTHSGWPLVRFITVITLALSPRPPTGDEMKSEIGIAVSDEDQWRCCTLGQKVDLPLIRIRGSSMDP